PTVPVVALSHPLIFPRAKTPRPVSLSNSGKIRGSVSFDTIPHPILAVPQRPQNLFLEFQIQGLSESQANCGSRSMIMPHSSPNGLSFLFDPTWILHYLFTNHSFFNLDKPIQSLVQFE
ncbi:MAG TPA: hypothetical protein PLH51_22840, partial [Polyangiaceae bacterium]|nr:hypothetical protein [Polyangiaceae bacterium]